MVNRILSELLWLSIQPALLVAAILDNWEMSHEDDIWRDDLDSDFRKPMGVIEL